MTTEPYNLPHNDHAFLLEPLLELDSFVARRMFGCLACYLYGRLMLVLADGDSPWNGLLVAMEREQHAALTKDFLVLTSHPVLGKWLYLSADLDDFETTAKKIVRCCLNNDQRIGVVPKPKKRKERR